MTIDEFLQSILGGGGQPQQNRLVNPWRGENADPSMLMAAGMPQAASPAAFSMAAPLLGEGAVGSSQPQAGPMPQAAPAPSSGGGNIFSRLFSGGGNPAQNETAQWLASQGYDPGTAQAIAGNKEVLQRVLLSQVGNNKPIEIAGKLVDPRTYEVIADFSDPQGRQTTTVNGRLVDAETGKVIADFSDPKAPANRQTATIDGKLVDTNTGEVIGDYGSPKPKKRDLTPEEVAARGYPPGSYQVDEATGDVSTVGGAREQDPTFGREVDLRKQYEGNKLVQNYQVVRDNFERIREGAQLGTGAGDMAVVYGYMKTLDPGSVIMEGERATAENASGVPDKVRNIYNRLVEGDILPPELRRQYIEAAGTIYKQTATNLSDFNKRYEAIATQWELDPSRILQQPEQYEPVAPFAGAGLPPPPVAPAPPAAVAPPGVSPAPAVKRRSWQELIAPGRQ